MSWQGRGGQELVGRSPGRGLGGAVCRPWAGHGMGMCAQICMHIYGGGYDLLALLWPQLWALPLEAPLETPPCPLWSNQSMAPAGKLIATALPVPALPKLITFFCLFLLLLLINHSPVLGPGERGLRERCQPWLSWAGLALGPSTSQACLWKHPEEPGRIPAICLPTLCGPAGDH